MSVHGLHRPARTLHRRWKVTAGMLVFGAGLGAYAALGTGSGAASPVAKTPKPQLSMSATAAPNGTLTTSSGATTTIVSLRGKPTMVWFVAGGCASCAASIPAVAAHIDQLTGAGLRVLTLGLYGDFAGGKKGATQLLSFGQAAAGSTRESITRPGWEWGMASKSLSLAYDPAGIPDQYVLVGPDGHIRYRNSVPDATMPQLLAAASRLTGAHVSTSDSRPATSAATLP